MKKLISALLLLAMLLSFAGCARTAELPTETTAAPSTSAPTTAAETTAPTETLAPEEILDPDGTYDTKDEVALYIHLYGKLPSNYVTKSQAKELYGWTGGALDTIAPGMAIGGDTFGNREGLLPAADGRTWQECDIGTIGQSQRGTKRIVFSNDGLVYYTEDHYNTFELLYGEP